MSFDAELSSSDGVHIAIHLNHTCPLHILKSNLYYYSYAQALLSLSQ